MFFYIVHKSPFWNKMSNKERNIRTFISGATLYAGLFIFMYSKFAEGKKELTFIRNYMYYVLMIDIVAMAVIYKLYYGKSILDSSDSNQIPNSNKMKKEDMLRFMRENPLPPLPYQVPPQMPMAMQQRTIPQQSHQINPHNQQMGIPSQQLIEVDDTDDTKSVEIPIYISKAKDAMSVVSVDIPIYKNQIPVYQPKKSEQ